MKKTAFIIALFSILICTACSDSDTTGTPENETATPEIEYTNSWPENENTSGVPVPDAGEITQVIIAPDGRYCAVTLEDMSQDDADSYFDKLEESGFVLVEEASEDLSGEGDVSIGTAYANGEVGVNVAYFDGVMEIYMAKLES